MPLGTVSAHPSGLHQANLLGLVLPVASSSGCGASRAEPIDQEQRDKNTAYVGKFYSRLLLPPTNPTSSRGQQWAPTERSTSGPRGKQLERNNANAFGLSGRLAIQPAAIAAAMDMPALIYLSIRAGLHTHTHKWKWIGTNNNNNWQLCELLYFVRH